MGSISIITEVHIIIYALFIDEGQKKKKKKKKMRSRKSDPTDRERLTDINCRESPKFKWIMEATNHWLFVHISACGISVGNKY